jgi:type II restriction/modification system DNA methylase subunit YeeA
MKELNKKLADYEDKNTSETARLKDEIIKTDTQIDELVYEIYGITDDEKKIIDASFKA